MSWFVPPTAVCGAADFGPAAVVACVAMAVVCIPGVVALRAALRRLEVRSVPTRRRRQLAVVE
jgi:hypothetical protein